MKLISLTQGYDAIVDDEDYDKASSYKWHTMKNKNLVYARRTITYPRVNGKQPSKKEYLHKFVLNIDESVMIGFKDGNPLNCQKDNLMVIDNRTKSLNITKRNKKDLPKGVRQKNDKFHARIANGSTEIFIGSFDNVEDADKAYKAKNKELQLGK